MVHCRTNENRPPVIGCEHVLEPEYVPSIAEALTPVALPVMLMEHDGMVYTPPGGTAIVKVKVVFERMPEIVPSKATALIGVVAAMVPVIALPT